MPAATPSVQVGAEVEAQCGRCHDATMHKVLATEKDKPKKVQCNACDAPHLYRKPKGPEDPRKRSRVKVSSEEEQAALYEKVIQAAGNQKPQAYKPTAHYEPGVLVNHKAFGPGVVNAVVRPKVIDVVFKDKTRRMAMDR